MPSERFRQTENKLILPRNFWPVADFVACFDADNGAVGSMRKQSSALPSDRWFKTNKVGAVLVPMNVTAAAPAYCG